MSSPITISGLNNQTIAILVNVLLNSIDSLTIQTPTAWPFSPNSFDFSGQGSANINIAADGQVTISFTIPGSPILRGMLDLTKLESNLVSAPNYATVTNDGAAGRPGALSGASAVFGGSYSSITKQKSGVVFVSAEINGTQSLQDVVTIALYRDYGLPGQTQLGSWSVSPGGVGAFNWSGTASAIDVLPDGSAHCYSIIATASGGSVLTVPASAVGSSPASIKIFEIGGPS